MSTQKKLEKIIFLVGLTKSFLWSGKTN